MADVCEVIVGQNDVGGHVVCGDEVTGYRFKKPMCALHCAQFVTCEFCNESEGHAAECPYPNTMAGRSEAFNKACRDLGRVLWRDFQRVWKRGRS